MKVLLMSGDHPRHKYVANLLKDNNMLCAWVIEHREVFLPNPPDNLPGNIREYFIQHFTRREESEAEVFGSHQVAAEKELRITPEELNSEKVVSFIRKVKPDIIITAGIGVIKAPIFESGYASEIWNVHGGLSPWYKGAITHFWPSYNLRPQHTGVTIHYVIPKIDAGNIIHQTGAVLQRGDGLHQLSGRSQKLGYDAIIPLIRRYYESGKIYSIPQKSTGKLWLKKDWTPYHLELVYGLYKDCIVDLYLDGKLPQDLPVLLDNLEIENKLKTV